MKLGIAYYPEHEQPHAWAADYRKLAEAGITSVRIAEFAWSVLEPRDGEYDWAWLDGAIGEAAAAGIGVVLCTPTACPPVWLSEKHPDILPVNKAGRTIGHGARQHRSYSSQHYVDHALRITARMAERYGDHPNVIAWQLDNEFGGETKYDYSDNARRAFHRYLAEKYGAIESLNERWGTVFWSQRYERWDQIPLPAPIGADVNMWHHPSLELEFARFSSDSMVTFARKQAETLRPYTGDVPITTNAFMFCWGDNLDWPALFAELDVVGMDIYSDKPHEIAFYADACRGVLGRPFWMMEYGTGSGELERDMELVRERGCSRFYLFKMKPFPWGQEQGGGHPELLTLTGEPSRNYGVVQRYAKRLAAEGAAGAAAGRAEGVSAKSPAPGTAGRPGGLPRPAAAARQALAAVEPVPARHADAVGLYYHFDSSWAYRLAVADRLDYADYVVHGIYRSLFEAGRHTEVVYTAGQIEGLDALIVPLHLLYDAALETALIAFVQGGGKLAVTADLFRKNADNVYLREVPRIFREVFGWHDNNFVPDAVEHRQPVIRTQESGRGKAWLVSRDAAPEEWRTVLEEMTGGTVRQR